MKALLITITVALTLLGFFALGRALASSDPPRTVGASMTTNPHDQILKETFHVAGDAPDPAGTGLRGQAPGYRFTQAALGHPLCFYSFGAPGGDTIVEMDVYAPPDQPMYVHLLCPHCLVRSKATHGITVRADQKGMSYDPHGIARTFPGWTDAQMARAYPRGTGGLISIDRFRCTWELDPALAVAQGHTRNPICDFDVIVADNVIRRAT